MHRFHLSPLDFVDDLLVIEDRRIVHQAFKVLRMKLGTFFHLFNETEGEFLVQIQEMDKRRILAKKIDSVPNLSEPQLKVTLYQAIPKKPALFELIVQKATEIGVSDIYPLITERTEHRRMARFERMHMIATEAAEQCRRLSIPTIHHPVDFESVLPKLSNGYIAYEYEGVRFLPDYRKDFQKKEDVQILIGPEGGLSQKEVSLAQKSGVHPFTLGARILRTETAAMSALSLILLSGEV